MRKYFKCVDFKSMTNAVSYQALAKTGAAKVNDSSLINSETVSNGAPKSFEFNILIVLTMSRDKNMLSASAAVSEGHSFES